MQLYKIAGSTTPQRQFVIDTLHSNNLYHFFIYVKNKEKELSGTEHEVVGMLHYEKTDELVLLNNEYKMSRSKISVTMLDLDQEFSGIVA